MKPVEAILLAGGQCKPMFPLTSPAVQALLPVVNLPLLRFPLHLLSKAAVKQVFVVVSGDKAALEISNWLSKEYSQPGSSLSYEIITTSESCGTAEAVRLAAPRITTESFVVLSGDLVSDVPLNAVILQHQAHEAMATVLLSRMKTSPSSVVKPGKAPKNVDYIGLTRSQDQLVFHATGHATLRDLKVWRGVQRQCGSVDIHTDLQDSHLYVFSRAVLDIIQAKPAMTSLSQDIMPYLAKLQFKGFPKALGDDTTGQSDDTDGEIDQKINGEQELPGSRFMDMSHAAELNRTSRVEVYIAEKEYCARVNTVAAYLDVNKEIATSKAILGLMGIELSARFDNYVPTSCIYGNKATVGSGCILGENTIIGDKSSVKRSILGSNCKLGKEVKLINCVLMDNVVVGDTCHIQNSIICTGAVMQDGCKLKDCQVGPGYQVAMKSDITEAVLAKP